MANKKGVIVYHDIIEQLEDFTDEQVGQMFRAIVNYDKDGTIPNFTGEMKLAFKFIKLTLDRNNEEYTAKCEMQRKKIQDYWDKQKNTNEYNSIQMNTMATYKDIDKDTDKEKDINKKEITKEKEQSSTHTPEKHKYGEYNHVLLTDGQYEKLVKDFGEKNTKLLIKKLDEAIEIKGYKYKNHNLVLRGWVLTETKKSALWEKKQPERVYVVDTSEQDKQTDEMLQDDKSKREFEEFMKSRKTGGVFKSL